MKIVVGVLLMMVTAAVAEAGCIKCDQTTSYWCVIRTDGTKKACDSPTSAGCITWGSCSSSGSDCQVGCEQYPTANAIPFSNHLRLATVSVTVRAPHRNAA